mmetsp:Transcript_122460/g.305780  ORF Transcript_122460/g.305780 Transcript_122460/m.305780 type:complete len:246 (-) Transcript_122460:284-1021(-)
MEVGVPEDILGALLSCERDRDALEVHVPRPRPLHVHAPSDAALAPRRRAGRRVVGIPGLAQAVGGDVGEVLLRLGRPDGVHSCLLQRQTLRPVLLLRHLALLGLSFGGVLLLAALLAALLVAVLLCRVEAGAQLRLWGRQAPGGGLTHGVSLGRPKRPQRLWRPACSFSARRVAASCRLRLGLRGCEPGGAQGFQSESRLFRHLGRCLCLLRPRTPGFRGGWRFGFGRGCGRRGSSCFVHVWETS